VRGVAGVMRLYTAVFDAKGRGELVCVEIATANTIYTTAMALRLFEHLHAELTVRV
jgi:hypothetical protein